MASVPIGSPLKTSTFPYKILALVFNETSKSATTDLVTSLML